MKFSVKHLLAITLLVALTINGCNMFFQMVELQIANSKWQSYLSGLRSRTVNVEARKLLYERAIEAIEKRKQLLDSEATGINE